MPDQKWVIENKFPGFYVFVLIEVLPPVCIKCTAQLRVEWQI